jgi:hypothetical protein
LEIPAGPASCTGRDPRSGRGGASRALAPQGGPPAVESGPPRRGLPPGVFLVSGGARKGGTGGKTAAGGRAARPVLEAGRPRRSRARLSSEPPQRRPVPTRTRSGPRSAGFCE